MAAEPTCLQGDRGTSPSARHWYGRRGLERVRRGWRDDLEARSRAPLEKRKEARRVVLGRCLEQLSVDIIRVLIIRVFSATLPFLAQEDP
eukprot:3227910-Pyramimonas_sp.AAC.1